MGTGDGDDGDDKAVAGDDPPIELARDNDNDTNFIIDVLLRFDTIQLILLHNRCHLCGCSLLQKPSTYYYIQHPILHRNIINIPPPSLHTSAAQPLPPLSIPSSPVSHAIIQSYSISHPPHPAPKD